MTTRGLIALCAVLAPVAASAEPPADGHMHMPHGAHEMNGMAHESAPPPPSGHAAHARHGETMGRTGALGPVPMTREASGTAWQPDTSVHGGLHTALGGWSLMGHALFNAVYDWQQGPRGGDKAFASGMVMGAARRDLSARDVVQLRAMLSPDPFMGKRGYPLLLAQGETADGVTALVDRQHPHDFVMELSASLSHAFGERTSVFVYGGLPGEPAFGPPAFMHRLSAMDSPEAPISHHWLDSTHITYGVVTAGVVHGAWKLEASRFHGREPDEHRYGIETGALESTAARISWNPTSRLSLQGSWARQQSPEQLHPDEDVTKWSASAIYTAPLAQGFWSLTAAWGRKSSHDGPLDAYVLEAALKPGDAWTLFARGERIESNELDLGAHGVRKVGRLSVGAIRDVRVSASTVLGVGAVIEQTFVGEGLEASYDGDPMGVMVFARLKLG